MIAEVALNIPLRRSFDYSIPPGDRDWVGPGCRVVVPFGRRLLGGIVVALKETSEIDPKRLKPIGMAAGGGTLFSAELLAFTRWVAGYYFCGWGEVLEAALPTGLGVRIETYYRVGQPPMAADALGRLAPPLRKLVESGAEWGEEQWKKAGAGDADRRWLWRHSRPGGGFEVRFRFAGTRARQVMEKWVRAGPSPASRPQGRRNPRRESRKEIVLRLLREEGEYPLVRLRALMSQPATVVRALAEAGQVELFEKKAASRFRRSVAPEPFLPLNDRQTEAFEAIRAGLRKGGYRPFLLEGVTGSGKTEVYLHAVRETLALGRSCLILVPEIALTENIVRRFRARFGDKVAVLHSGLSGGERFDEWHRVHQGEATIVVGARSAVFSPLARLGLVVVDEEHDGSYKQDETPRYHGRDAAIMRANLAGATVVLGSATPSLESLRNVARGKLERLALPRRIHNRPLPVVEVLDLKAERRQQGSPFFTVRLVDGLREVLRRKEQAILFLNRRGFAHVVRCGPCEEPVVCPHCSITLTFHQAAGRLRCHRCDFSRGMPRRCPACGQRREPLEVMGLGTERIAGEAEMMFPDARVLRMDSDSLRRRGELERMLAAIRRGDYDIIVGTQILSKGHDFPQITLVGAILADVSLNLPDFRAAERTFQILTQMAGRAGRGELAGRVIIQTYNPGHYALTHVRTHDTARFFEEEMRYRKDSASPPTRSQALVWVSGPDPGRAQALAAKLANRLRSAAREVLVEGAVEGAIKKIGGRYRWMIQLRGGTIQPIHRLLHQVLESPDWRVGQRERVVVDIDPYNVM
ncbi:MAG: primosomal protein N' [bacterium]